MSFVHEASLGVGGGWGSIKRRSWIELVKPSSSSSASYSLDGAVRARILLQRAKRYVVPDVMGCVVVANWQLGLLVPGDIAWVRS